MSTTLGMPTATWHELVDRRGREIYELAFRLTGNAAQAAHVTVRAFELVRAETSERSPLYSDARLQAIAVSTFLNDRHTAHDPMLPEHDRGDPVQAALDALPSPERLAVVLHDVAGMTADDIATTCGMSRTEVYRRLRRSRERLHATLCQAHDPTSSTR